MNTKPKDNAKRDSPPLFTKEEYYAGKAFEYLEGIENAYQRGMETERLTEHAKKEGFMSFKTHFRQYLAMKQEEDTQGFDADDPIYTEFEGQKLELKTAPWRSDHTGIWKPDGKGGKEYACTHPIMPVQILRSVDTRRFKVRLIFRRGGNRGRNPWEKAIVAMEELADPKTIVKALAPLGVSITGGKRAYSMMDYLREVIDGNADIIPEIKSVSRLGWHDEGFFPYVGTGIEYDSADTFDRAYRTIRRAGTYQAWRDEALAARSYSLTARILLAASFAAPLIEPIGTSSFFVHTWGGSGTGKTVAQMLSASVWAYPVRGGGFFQTFDSTSVGLELVTGFLHSLPLFIDETQQAKDKRGKVQVNLYDLTSESGRLRANAALGLNYTPTWKTVFITSGETPITNETDGEGALNRAFEIECATGQKVIENGHKTAETVKRNYGWAGADFIRRLCSDGQIDRTKGIYEKYLDALMRSDTTEKQAICAAVILTADFLATEWIFKDNRALTIKEIAEFMKSKESVSLMERGYQFFCDWVAINAARLQGLDDEAAGRDCYGKIEDGVAYIIRSVFNQVCAENELDARPLLSALRAKGLIICKGRGFTNTRYLGRGQSPNCVWLRLPSDSQSPSNGERYSHCPYPDDMELL